MRRRTPLEVNAGWTHPLPMPMPGQPVSATLEEAEAQLSRLPASPRVFMWTELEQRCPDGWGYLPSVRPGAPPESIEAELGAWMRQYPEAWLAVDLRVGTMAPATRTPLDELLRSMRRPVILIVDEEDGSDLAPRWQLPF